VKLYFLLWLWFTAIPDPDLVTVGVSQGRGLVAAAGGRDPAPGTGVPAPGTGVLAADQTARTASRASPAASQEVGPAPSPSPGQSPAVAPLTAWSNRITKGTGATLRHRKTAPMATRVLPVLAALTRQTVHTSCFTFFFSSPFHKYFAANFTFRLLTPYHLC
jgi:hypothetical protein